MNRSLIALSLLAVMTVSACASNGGTWTPMSSGRTAGEGSVQNAAPSKADKTFSNSLRK